MAWWANYKPGGVEAALEQREQGRRETQNTAIAAHFREQEARYEAERQRERQEAEALRERLREQKRGGKLAWARLLRETPQMREIRIAAEKERGANDAR